jgi:hypothetical protein
MYLKGAKTKEQCSKKKKRSEFSHVEESEGEPKKVDVQI